MKLASSPIDRSRRNLLKGSLAVGGMFAFQSMMPAWASPRGLAHAPATKTGATLTGEDIALSIANSSFSIGNRTGHAVTVNGSLPAPLIRLREGQNVRLAVTNHLEEDTSIH